MPFVSARGMCHIFLLQAGGEEDSQDMHQLGYFVSPVAMLYSLSVYKTSSVHTVAT